MTLRNEHAQYKDLARYETLEDWPEVKGYDFEREFDFSEFLDSFKHMGIQATNLARGMEIAREMRSSTIFLSCTSNMVSSGNREVIRFLVKKKHIQVLVMSAGAVEEDIIKTIKPFVLGSFQAPGSTLLDKGIGRIGNIFAPYERYLHLERFMRPFIKSMHERQKELERPLNPSEFIQELGLAIDDEGSILHWAARNDIPVFCPALTDGAIGDMLIFARREMPNLAIDIVGDSEKIMKIALDSDRTGAILLGGGVSKHYILNANIFRDGLDSAIYITTANEYDASDSGGDPQEAMSWAKLKPNAPNVKIHCDASIAFPLLVAGSFARPLK